MNRAYQLSQAIDEAFEEYGRTKETNPRALDILTNKLFNIVEISWKEAA